MPQECEILLLDDGELSDVADVLDELGLAFTRLRGGEVASDLAPPGDLLISTPRRAQAVRRGSPRTARAGRPTRIIAVQEDSTAMRRMMRRMGFHLLVRIPTDRSVWELLIRRAVYQGAERRTDLRVAVGSQVSLGDPSEEQSAVLMDISNRGCRLQSREPFELGHHVRITLPDKTTGDEPLELRGSYVRVSTEMVDDHTVLHTGALAFDSDLGDAKRTRLGSVINRWSIGPDSVTTPPESGAVLPPTRCPSIPGLMLDSETDPSIRVGERVSVQREGESTPGEPDIDRRSHTRSAYVGPVIARTEGGRRVLMGRDLSVGGMRIEALGDIRVGDRFRLAIHGSLRNGPFEVDARVARDDGHDGFAVIFEEVDPSTAQELEKLLACLPEVESLEEDETRGLGAVIAEILDDHRRLG